MAKDKSEVARKQDEFEEFLSEMDFELDRLCEDAKGRGLVLDGSLQSLGALEHYYLAVENNHDKDQLLNRVARYFGQVVVDKYGGQWKLAIDDPEDAYYGLPVVVGHTKFDVELCPLDAVHAFAVKKQEGLLLQIVDNDIDPKKLNLKPDA